MDQRSIRDARREKQRRKKLFNKLIWGGIILIILGIGGFIGWRIMRPSVGEKIPIMANSGKHLEEGSDPGPYNSNPPTSGPHYGGEFEAGFYNETSQQAQAPYPEGYLGHNLEHGYVIFWYDCGLLDDTGCDTLKTQIQIVMDKFNGFKLIAFPARSLDVPLVMVSWGQMLRFETFDEGLARQFVSVNRNRAPEPDAP
jgi:hypothetical protein